MTAVGSGFRVALGKHLVQLAEPTMLCDLRDPPSLYCVGEKVKDIKDRVVVIEKFGIIVSEGGNVRGALCKSRGGWLRFLPLIQLEKFDDSEVEED